MWRIGPMRWNRWDDETSPLGKECSNRFIFLTIFERRTFCLFFHLFSFVLFSFPRLFWLCGCDLTSLSVTHARQLLHCKIPKSSSSWSDISGVFALIVQNRCQRISSLHDPNIFSRRFKHWSRPSAVWYSPAYPGAKSLMRRRSLFLSALISQRQTRMVFLASNQRHIQLSQTLSSLDDHNLARPWKHQARCLFVHREKSRRRRHLRSAVAHVEVCPNPVRAHFSNFFVITMEFEWERHKVTPRSCLSRQVGTESEWRS